MFRWRLRRVGKVGITPRWRIMRCWAFEPWKEKIGDIGQQEINMCTNFKKSKFGSTWSRISWRCRLPRHRPIAHGPACEATAIVFLTYRKRARRPSLSYIRNVHFGSVRPLLFLYTHTHTHTSERFKWTKKGYYIMHKLLPYCILAFKPLRVCRTLVAVVVGSWFIATRNSKKREKE